MPPFQMALFQSFPIKEGSEFFHWVRTSNLFRHQPPHSPCARHSFRADVVSKGGFVKEKEVAKLISSWESLQVPVCFLEPQFCRNKGATKKVTNKSVCGCLFYAELRAFGFVPAESPYFKHGNFWDQAKKANCCCYWSALKAMIKAEENSHNSCQLWEALWLPCPNYRLFCGEHTAVPF